ncbi:MAG: hypothetical protein GQE15_01360 [Archangiaceae bacterium]|nr:hypothetical protein [Archangiaceae bacterium]
MSRLCAAAVFALASLSAAAPCREPAPIDATPLEKADPSLVTWTSATKFATYPPTLKLPSASELAARVAKLEARNPGFTVKVDDTGRLVSLSSTSMPCALVEARAKDSVTNSVSAAAIDPWFDELAWAVEQRNWDALGHLVLPTKAKRSMARVIFERDRTDGGLLPRFVLQFWSDPRPVPRAGRVLSQSALRGLVKNCQLEAARETCAPCQPPGPCPCARFVRARRACGANLVFDVRDHYVEKNGERRYLRIATGNVSDIGLPRFEDAPWNLTARPLPMFDAVTGGAVMQLWEDENLPVPVDQQAEPVHGMIP